MGRRTPREGPFAFAISPLDGAIGILDWANSRVQVFDSGGSIAAEYKLPGAVGGYRDVAFDSANRVVVLRTIPEDSSVIVFEPDGGVDSSYPIPADLNAEKLSVIGDDIWVWTVDNVSYSIALGAKSLAREDLVTARQDAFVAQSGAINVTRQSAESLLATVTKADG